MDKVILITGATMGIGRAVAEACAASGARVMAHGLEPDLAADLERSLGASCRTSSGDLSDPALCAKLVNDTCAAFGRIDALVNNAALISRSGIDSVTADSFDRMMAINLRAPLLLAQQAVACFRAQGRGGAVLNIGSTNALSGESSLLEYSIAKGGLMTMTRNLANALAPEGIRFVQINVGWVLTDSERERQRKMGMPEGWEKSVPREWAPRGSLTTPEEVAQHALFWLSEGAAPASGVVYELEQFSVMGKL